VGDPKERVLQTHRSTLCGCGSWKRIQLHHVSYESLDREPDQDLVPLEARGRGEEPKDPGRPFTDEGIDPVADAYAAADFAAHEAGKS
jgi:2,4-dienoyl-CoA reductase-like NADH-dependent reductase (Old Yellow Enzyme family)